MFKFNNLKKVAMCGTLCFTSFAYADLNTVVSIVPQKTFVKAIGGDKVDVSLMVKPGNSPHSYEPKPSQMKDISKADLYFAIDVEFEQAWLPKFKKQNIDMKIVDLSDGIHKLKMEKHSHDEEDHDDDHHGHYEDKHHEEHEDHAEHDKHEGLDPHIWTSPSNVKIIAKNIYKALVKNDPSNKNYYEANYEKFLEHIRETDKKIKRILIDVDTGSKFMVFHPAWGYFANDYGLKQIAIEAGGKNPKPKQLAHLIEEAKEEKIKAVFTAPEFSDKAAKQIAKEVSVPVIKVSPLNPKWSQNLQRLAKAISNK
ncbi:MAG: zinc ABC transporter substrate-binding protein [Campylobacterota bacterium]|nr:zinc ABC transporter substrate-binding protein [Campylobacterota bacterium]